MKRDGRHVPEVYETQIKEKSENEIEFDELRSAHGLTDERTLKVAFKLLDLWIGLYELDLTERLLQAFYCDRSCFILNLCSRMFSKVFYSFYIKKIKEKYFLFAI